MKRDHWVAAAMAGFLIAAFSFSCAAQQPEVSGTVKPIAQAKDKAKFGGLEVLPSCLTFAVYRGDPKTGPSLLLIKMKSGCVVPWHWHTAREELMLVSGKGKVELADFPTQVIEPGGYVLLPAKHHHQFTCQTDCVFFNAISGKFDIHYLDKSGNEIPVEQALQAVSEQPGKSN
ncbi:cupin domain-containing protein [Microbulbifer hainanensis]|uniref:cupin domain-containing protein n=1 Tax=Microbulbifer hainanensis TaxID=2735675 RepID=UPI001866058D|nr:cupin domain-containing protein [Microbulbifer hainanensis]